MADSTLPRTLWWRRWTMVLLAATLLIAGVAAMPTALSAPKTPTVIATANPGELIITWDAVPEAQHYTIGYANVDELDRIAGRREGLVRRVPLRHHRSHQHHPHPQWLEPWN